ncbi:unnamed protein product [Blepharisma stoltei]|uniref:G domain-containing protein n=1 Tax=Blepharisma stoltei TaxID=1481888 RepID=A0AAU9JZB1_9CILI|nr:unnamed protein product [Blepharisma stoltei]
MSEMIAEVFAEVKAKLNTFKNNLDQKNQNNIQKSVILYGPTGSGKTTLFHALNDDQLTIQLGSRGLSLKAGENSLIPGKIGQNVNSETSEPNLYYNQSSKILYVDCPGQEDTHGWTQDLANAFYNFSVFNSCRNKILLYVISEHEIATKAVVFRNSLGQLLRLFENNFEELINNSYLIFTMKQNISDFALALSDINIDQTCMNYIRFLIDNNRIISFPHPSQFYERQVANGDLVPNIYKNEILDKIAELPGMRELQNLNISVAAGTLIAIEEPEKSINREFIDYVNGPISSAIENKANEIVNSGKNQRLAAINVRNRLIAFKSSLDALKSSQDYNTFVQAITSFASQNGIHLATEKLQENLNFISLFRQIKPGAFSDQSFLQLASIIADRIKSKINAEPSIVPSIQTEERQRPGLEREHYNTTHHWQGPFKRTTKHHFQYYRVYDTYHRQVIKHTFTLTNNQRVEFVEEEQWQKVGAPRKEKDHTDWCFA